MHLRVTRLDSAKLWHFPAIEACRSQSQMPGSATPASRLQPCCWSRCGQAERMPLRTTWSAQRQAPRRRRPPVRAAKFKFMFGAPAKWPSTLRWYYNHTGAPAQFSSAKDAVIQQIIAQSAKWTAICGVDIAYAGETAAVPQTLAGGPDGVSVVGWKHPDMGISGATYVWYQSYGSQQSNAGRIRHDAGSRVRDNI